MQVWQSDIFTLQSFHTPNIHDIVDLPFLLLVVSENKLDKVTEITLITDP